MFCHVMLCHVACAKAECLFARLSFCNNIQDIWVEQTVQNLHSFCL